MNNGINKLIKIATILAIIILFGYFLNVKIKQIHTSQNISSKPQTVTSFYPLYFFTSQIAQDKAEIYNITPAGAEPHDYEPSTRDIAKIEDSSLLVLNGGKLEAWGEKIKENLKDKKTLIVTVGETIANQEVTEDGKKIQDPHIWLDPTLAKKEVIMIAQGLSQVDPANNLFYQANAQKLLNKLDILDAKFRQGLNSCARKDIITSHAAFGYLASDYGLNQVAISGLSPDSEPSVQKLAEVSDFAKANQVKYIFFESLVSPKLSQTVATEIGAQTLVLNPIEGLSDEEIKNGKNYFSEMENNLKNLKIALECQ